MKCAISPKTALTGHALSVLLVLLASQCAAQSLSNLPDLSSLSTSLGGGSTSSSDSSTSSATSTASSAAKTTSSTKATSASSKEASTTTESASVSLLIQTSSSTTNDASSSTSIFHLSDLPTIAGASNPTQVVPYTANAPFMQKSNMPEGSVFIIVGAILGFFGACVLAWRGMVALSLQRSVKRAALAQHQTFDLKSHAYAPSGGIYSGSAAADSSPSMEKLAAIPKRSNHRPSTSQGNVPPMYNPLGAAGARGSTHNLFFSPTAGAGLHSHGSSPNPSQRPASAAYLPAGYYAAGSSLPAGGAATTHINAHAAPRGSSMLNPLTDRLSGLRAESAGYQRTNTFTPSPPDSPGLAPSAVHHHRVRADSPGGASSVAGQVGGPTIGGNGLYAQSGSSLNLNVPGGSSTQGGRTPSAYLDDLFENHGNGPRER